MDSKYLATGVRVKRIFRNVNENSKKLQVRVREQPNSYFEMEPATYELRWFGDVFENKYANTQKSTKVLCRLRRHFEHVQFPPRTILLWAGFSVLFAVAAATAAVVYTFLIYS